MITGNMENIRKEGAKISDLISDITSKVSEAHTIASRLKTCIYGDCLQTCSSIGQSGTPGMRDSLIDANNELAALLTDLADMLADFE